MAKILIYNPETGKHDIEHEVPDCVLNRITYSNEYGTSCQYPNPPAYRIAIKPEFVNAPKLVEYLLPELKRLLGDDEDAIPT